MSSIQSRVALAQHPAATFSERSPWTRVFIIPTRDLQKVEQLPTDNIPDMLQHLPIAQRDRVPVDEIRRVEFDPENKIPRNGPAGFGGYPAG